MSEDLKQPHPFESVPSVSTGNTVDPTTWYGGIPDTVERARIIELETQLAEKQREVGGLRAGIHGYIADVHSAKAALRTAIEAQGEQFKLRELAEEQVKAKDELLRFAAEVICAEKCVGRRILLTEHHQDCRRIREALKGEAK